MKKIISILLVLLTLGGALAFAEEKTEDPYDSLVEKLLKDYSVSGSSVAVKIFNGDMSMNERKQISKSVQFALYCVEDIEIAASATDADYICSGKIEVDGPNYIITAKLLDAYDDTVIGKAKQKVPKNYYAKGEQVKVETVVVEKEHDIGAEEILGAVVVGSVIGGVFHALTPHHYIAPAPIVTPLPVRP